MGVPYAHCIYASFPSNVKLSDVITPLWHAKENTDVVNKFMYNNLIRGMAYFPNDPKNLAAFKEYMLAC